MAAWPPAFLFIRLRVAPLVTPIYNSSSIPIVVQIVPPPLFRFSRIHTDPPFAKICDLKTFRQSVDSSRSRLPSPNESQRSAGRNFTIFQDIPNRYRLFSANFARSEILTAGSFFESEWKRKKYEFWYEPSIMVIRPLGRQPISKEEIARERDKEGPLEIGDLEERGTSRVVWTKPFRVIKRNPRSDVSQRMTSGKKKKKKNLVTPIFPKIYSMTPCALRGKKEARKKFFLPRAYRSIIDPSLHSVGWVEFFCKPVPSV